MLLYACVPIDGGKSFFRGCMKAFAILSNIFESQLITDFIEKSITVLIYHLTKNFKSKSVFMLIFVNLFFKQFLLINQVVIFLFARISIYHNLFYGN